MTLLWIYVNNFISKHTIGRKILRHRKIKIIFYRQSFFNRENSKWEKPQSKENSKPICNKENKKAHAFTITITLGFFCAYLYQKSYIKKLIFCCSQSLKFFFLIFAKMLSYKQKQLRKILLKVVFIAFYVLFFCFFF